MRLSSIVGAVVVAAVCTTAARPVQAQAQAQAGIVVQTINFEKVAYNAGTGVLTATGGTLTGTLNGLPFDTDITKFELRHAPGNGRRCAILNLELGPIHLAVLGLFVDTSPICLDITAFEGRGLLGDLLCGLAGRPLPLPLLNNNAGLLSGLTQILNSALGRARNAHGTPPGQGGTPPGQGGTPPGQGGGDGDTVCTGECEILNLVIGPLTLNLLGVRVELDNCENGPVEVCISASEGEGLLLGNLLCGLTDDGLLDGINLRRFLDLLDELLDEIGGLPVGV